MTSKEQGVAGILSEFSKKLGGHLWVGFGGISKTAQTWGHFLRMWDSTAWQGPQNTGRIHCWGTWDFPVTC